MFMLRFQMYQLLCGICFSIYFSFRILPLCIFSYSIEKRNMFLFYLKQKGRFFYKAILQLQTSSLAR